MNVLLSVSASGRELMRDAVRELAFRFDDRDRFHVLESDPQCVSASTFGKQLARLDLKGDQLTVVWVGSELIATSHDPNEIVRVSDEVTTRVGSKGGTLRIVFDADIEGMWRIMSGATQEEAANLEGRTVAVGRWALPELRVWLSASHLRLLDDRPVVELMQATGGWYWLIDKYWHMLNAECASLDNEDPLKSLDRFDEALNGDDGSLAPEFAGSLGSPKVWPDPIGILWGQMGEWGVLREIDLPALAELTQSAHDEISRAFGILRMASYLTPFAQTDDDGATELGWLREPLAARFCQSDGGSG